ncbi:hypothetical protein GALMADRAFT_1032014 [Galerina marginata CBS 339.88]|uniref:Uncharacterized protein n=1 Tax=Galerina marginata (strain CBS 339.88) TaxID=685588 RepID=A0A067SFN6_GALM3|nr:hypothetical protein GALMADRAFT_1032014 [Galerina marginata CBS 339.88]
MVQSGERGVLQRKGSGTLNAQHQWMEQGGSWVRRVVSRRSRLLSSHSRACHGYRRHRVALVHAGANASFLSRSHLCHCRRRVAVVMWPSLRCTRSGLGLNWLTRRLRLVARGALGGCRGSYFVVAMVCALGKEARRGGCENQGGHRACVYPTWHSLRGEGRCGSV